MRESFASGNPTSTQKMLALGAPKDIFSQENILVPGWRVLWATEQGPSFESNLGKRALVLGSRGRPHRRAFTEGLEFLQEKGGPCGTWPTFMRQGLGREGNILRVWGWHKQYPPPPGKGQGHQEGTAPSHCPRAPGDTDLLWRWLCLWPDFPLK